MQNLIEKHLYKKSLISFLLWPISIFYSRILILRRKFHPPGYRSCCQIISVGNIVSGGSGKTPITIFLAKFLQKQGKKVAVSHRGYKGKYEQENKLISNESEIFSFAREAGDETFLLASKLSGIPVIAGKDRKLSIKILEAKYPNLDFIILDDSFQNLKIQHDYDLVVFNTLGGIGNGFVLPSGILQEPLSALKYSNYIIFNGEGTITKQIEKTGKPILRGKYKVRCFYSSQNKKISLDELRNTKLALLSGIGQPRSFERTIEDCGLKFQKHFIFQDHYLYRNEKKLAGIKDYDYVLTTEKDFAKLQFIKHDLPLVVVEIEFELEDSEKLLELKKILVNN